MEKKRLRDKIWAWKAWVRGYAGQAKILRMLFHRNTSNPVLQLNLPCYSQIYSFCNPDSPSNIATTHACYSIFTPGLWQSAYSQENYACFSPLTPPLLRYTRTQPSYNSPLLLPGPHKRQLHLSKQSAEFSLESHFPHQSDTPPLLIPVAAMGKCK